MNEFAPKVLDGAEIRDLKDHYMLQHYRPWKHVWNQLLTTSDGILHEHILFCQNVKFWLFHMYVFYFLSLIFFWALPLVLIQSGSRHVCFNMWWQVKVLWSNHTHTVLIKQIRVAEHKGKVDLRECLYLLSWNHSRLHAPNKNFSLQFCGRLRARQFPGQFPKSWTIPPNSQ